MNNARFFVFILPRAAALQQLVCMKRRPMTELGELAAELSLRLEQKESQFEHSLAWDCAESLAEGIIDAAAIVLSLLS